MSPNIKLYCFINSRRKKKKKKYKLISDFPVIGRTFFLMFTQKVL